METYTATLTPAETDLIENWEVYKEDIVQKPVNNPWEPKIEAMTQKLLKWFKVYANVDSTDHQILVNRHSIAHMIIAIFKKGPIFNTEVYFHLDIKANKLYLGKNNFSTALRQFYE